MVNVYIIIYQNGHVYHIILYIKMVKVYHQNGQEATDMDVLVNPAYQNLFQIAWCVVEPGKEHDVYVATVHSCCLCASMATTRNRGQGVKQACHG